jgi:WD40 repeat protein
MEDSSFLSEDWTIRLWDIKSGKLFAAPLQGHQDHILSLAFHSGRGMRIVSGSSDKTVRI